MSRLFGWGSFDTEPVGVYREKEQRRATELGQQGRREKLPEVRGRNSILDFARSRVIEAVREPEKVRERIERLPSFDRPFGRREEREGGGVMGGLRSLGSRALDVGKGALDVLDAGAETSRDLFEAQMQINPLTGGSVALYDVIRGRNPIESGARRAAGGGTFENIAASRSPGDFVQRQVDDLNQRGFVDRLGTQVMFDPSNAVGIGLGAKATAAGARAAASGGRGARLSGAILRGIGRADTALDAAQARYAREVVGGVGGFTASAMQGGDTQQNLTAAATGVLAGRASRYLPGRFGTPNAAKNFPLGAQITDETPNVERYAEMLDRRGIAWSFEDGAIRVADPEAAERMIADDFNWLLERTENRPGKYGDVIRTFEGDGVYVNRADPTGTTHTVDYPADGSPRRGPSMTDAEPSIYRQELSGADYRSLDDTERLVEILDEGAPDPFKESLRQPWPEGSVIQRFKPQDDEWMAYVEKEYAGRGGGKGNYRPIELGRFEADRWVAQRVNPEWSPAATLKAIYTEVDYMEKFPIRLAGEGKGIRERAFTDRLREIAAHIETRGVDAILPPNAGRTVSSAANEGRIGVEGAARASDEGAAAVPLLDDAGEASPTSALAPEGDPRYESFRGLQVGDRVEDAMRPGRFGQVTNVSDIAGRRVGVEVRWEKSGAVQKFDNFKAPIRPAASAATPPPAVARRRRAAAQPAPSPAAATPPVAGSVPQSAPRGTANAGRLPRPDGAPATVTPPGGEGGVVGEQRAQTPRAYEYSVPEGKAPQYRRMQTDESLELQDAKPAPAPLGGPVKFSGPVDDVMDDFASAVEQYHPQLAQPHDTLSQDYQRIRNAARSAARREYMNDIMEASGLEPSDLKADPDLARDIRKQANAQAERAVREVEEAVLKDGFWDPLAASGSRGEGLMEGRPTGGVGGNVEQPSGTPPIDPPAPPAPREPGPGNPQRGFGQDGPTVDLLEGRARDSVIADAGSALSNSRVQRIREKVGRAKDATIQAITREKQRTDHIVRERTGYQVDQLRARAERAGLRIVPDGDRWVLQGTDVAIEDVVEGQTEAALAVRNSLSADQRAVLDDVQAINDRWNRTIEAHGGEVAKTETATGDYWTRSVTGREVEGRTIAKNKPGGGGRSLGAARIGRRTQESVEAGIEGGLIYDNPWDALKGGLRNKARIAQDHYLANMVSPLAQPAAKGGFGYRSLKGNHPLLEKVRFVGSTDSGGTLLGRERLVFPNEVADALDNLLTPTSLTDTKIGRAISAINSVGTPLRAMADVSYVLNQGMGFLQSSPRNAIKAMRNSVDVVRSALGDPDSYYRLLDDEVARGNDVLRQADIGEDVGEWLTARGQHYVDEDAVYEFQFPRFVENAPGIGGVAKWSNETFARYLNLSRVTLNVDQLERAIASGLRGEELSRHMEEAIKATNRMTGWSGSKVTGAEQLGLFAPRFFRSQIEQIAAAFTKGGVEGGIARQHLLKLAGFGIATTVAVNEMRGHPTDLDPRSNNFLRMRDIGGQDISPFGPFATIIRAAAQGVAGEPGDTRIGDPLGSLERFMRAKASPTVSTAWSLMTERTYDGRPVSKNPREKEFWTNTLPDIARESIPFSAQALVNEGIEPAIRDRDPKQLVSGAIGAGLSALGAQASQVTPSEKRDFRRDKVAAEMFDGAKYDDLTGAQKAQINEDPEVAGHQAEAERRQLEGTGDDRKRTEAQRAYLSKIEANSTFLESGRDDAGSVFTGNDFRDAYNDAVQQRIGAFATLEEIGGDKALRGYFDLYEKATMANGQLNHAEFDRLESQYILKHPGILRKVDEVVGTRDNATMREFRKAKVQAAQYYQIPAYKGMTVEDANRATEIITRANALVSYGRAPNRAGALAYLVDSGEITEAERQIAIAAAKNGANPERRAFRVDPANKPFAKFYSDLTAKEAALDAGYATPVSSGGGGSTKRKPAITSGGSSRRRSSRRR